MSQYSCKQTKRVKMRTVIFSASTEYRSNVSRAPCSNKFVTTSLNRATTCKQIRNHTVIESCIQTFKGKSVEIQEYCFEEQHVSSHNRANQWLFFRKVLSMSIDYIAKVHVLLDEK